MSKAITKTPNKRKNRPIELVPSGVDNSPLEILPGDKKPIEVLPANPLSEAPGKKRYFTPRQITALRLRLSGKSISAIAQTMGVAHNTVKKSINDAKSKLDKNSELVKALEANMIDFNKIAKVLGDCMDAQTTIITKHGAATNPDHRVRLEAAKYATQLHNAEPAKKVEVETTTFEQRLILIAKMDDSEDL